MHKRIFSFVLLFLLFFGLAIGSKLLSTPTTGFATANLYSTDSLVQFLLNPDLSLETNNWMAQVMRDGQKQSSFEMELTPTPLANLNFNQEIDLAIAPPLLPDILAEIVSKG